MKTFEIWCWIIFFTLLSYFVIKFIFICKSKNEEPALLSGHLIQTNKLDNV